MVTKNKAAEVVKLKPLNIKSIQVNVVGITPLIQHQWSEKAKREMREKHAGRKTKDRAARDGEQEASEATYRTESGEYGIPLTAIKSAMIAAAHKDIGIEKTLVKKSVFIRSDSGLVLPMQCADPVVREDYVRIGQGSTDLRYRPQFDEWSLNLHIDYDADLLTVDDVVNLLNRAGFGVGIGEWRPEKGGEFGRFRVA